jgi:acyl-coenzyme A thioesterase PaaI-like protein
VPFADRLPRRIEGRNWIRRAWDLLSGVPGGKVVFSRLVGRLAPYTGSIHATVTVLRAGYAEVAMPDRKSLRNHLDCVHTVALVNLGEFAANMALGYTLPDDARFIVSGLEVEYAKKARGTIIAIADAPIPRTAARATYDVTVALRDSEGDVVARVTSHVLVGPKPGSTSDRGDVN